MSKYSKALFGTAQESFEATRTKPTGMIANSIQPKKTKINNTHKKNVKSNIKKPNSFSK